MVREGGWRNSFFKELLRTTRYQTCWCKSDKNHWFFKVFKGAHLVPTFRYHLVGSKMLKKKFFMISEEHVHQTSIFIDRIESRNGGFPCRRPPTPTPGLSLLAGFSLIFIIDFHWFFIRFSLIFIIFSVNWVAGNASTSIESSRGRKTWSGEGVGRFHSWKGYSKLVDTIPVGEKIWKTIGFFKFFEVPIW